MLISGLRVAIEKIGGKTMFKYGTKSCFIIRHSLFHADNRYAFYGSFESSYLFYISSIDWMTVGARGLNFSMLTAADVIVIASISYPLNYL